MRLVVISGRSGSGKSTALHILEDLGFTCIDNLPAGLLPGLFAEIANGPGHAPTHIAVGIDARNLMGNLDELAQILERLRDSGVRCEVVFLDARTPILIRRYSETRRKHPLSSLKIDLKQALALEREILEPVAAIADRQIDTSNMTLHQLRDLVKKQIVPGSEGDMAILFNSFGFKHGVPLDADFVFDVRNLPNPYWKPELRNLTGRDPAVVAFLESQTDVAAMLADLIGFFSRWLPKLVASNRSYLTIAIGCTGGQHRSVYIARRLYEYFQAQYPNVQIQHRELEDEQTTHP
ncbi:MAG: RNase adapter RapZ [Porticoccaceae bacterium]|nr:RNase adapter RapZ [Porticoccaceae bacterium]HLS98693.1 RNase adapter RapZ [Porticoccaceae bacterium]